MEVFMGVFFFFQAEDGIRDGRVTGVQTCALPISERAQTEEAIRALATGRPTRLSDVRRLDRHEFALFLRLLGEALAAGPPGRDGTTVTRTSDGALEVMLTLIPGGGTVTIETDDGLLHGPDHEITVVDLRAGRGPVLAGAGHGAERSAGHGA